MTIAYDSSSSTAREGASNPATWTHTPVGTPKGVVVSIGQMPYSTDSIVGVTYGGVALSRVVRAEDVSSEKGASELWFRGTGIPAGASTVSVGFVASGTTARMLLTAITVTAAGDTEVVDFDSINGDVADPEVTLQYSSRTCLAVACHYGGAFQQTAFTPLSTCTEVSSFDFGPCYAINIRQITPASSDFSIGGNANLEDAAFTAMAIGEIATAPSVGTVVHVESSAFTLGSETTRGQLVIPVTTQSGDDIFVFVTSRDHNVSTAYPTCTDNDTSGNTFQLVTSAGAREGLMYWKKATAATAGKTVTVEGMVGSAAGGCSVYRNAAPDGLPVTSIQESSATQNPVVPGFTPVEANSMICITVFNTQNDVGISAISCTSPGSLTSRFQSLSTGGGDCAVIHASSLQTTGLAPTGNFTWVQANNTNVSLVFAITSSATTVPSSTSTANSGTTQNPVHTYGSAGTYIAKLIVIDSDGNVSSATTRAVRVV